MKKRKDSDLPNEKAPVERIILDEAEGKKVQLWATALNERFDGSIRLTKSDVVNFIIRERSDVFAEAEIAKIESEFYSELRWLSWATTKVRAAKKEGRSLSLNDLMANRPQALATKKPQMKRIKKSHDATDERENVETSADENPIDAGTDPQLK